MMLWILQFYNWLFSDSQNDSMSKKKKKAVILLQPFISEETEALTVACIHSLQVLDFIFIPTFLHTQI